MDYKAELQGKVYEREYLQHELNRIKNDIFTIDSEIYEIEQIMSANTLED